MSRRSGNGVGRLMALVAALLAASLQAGHAATPLYIYEGEVEDSPVDSIATQVLLARFTEDDAEAAVASYSEADSADDDDHDGPLPRYWAKHMNGRCSYNGYRASRCPRPHECRPGDVVCCVSHGRTCFANPPPCKRVGEPCKPGRARSCCGGLSCSETFPHVCRDATCGSVGAACGAPGACCSSNCANGTCCAEGKRPMGADCTVDSDCCVNYCYANAICCKPINADCLDSSECCSGSCLSNKCFNPCFSGDTLVNILESPTPVAIRDVQTGQHIMAVATGADMRAPVNVTWVEVTNWNHAQTLMYKQTRINFTGPNGVAGSTTLSPQHLVMRLTDATVSAGDTAGTVDAFGPFANVPAPNVRTGDKLAMFTPPAGFVVVVVTAVYEALADGMYMPALEFPFIIADGLVAPLWINSKLTVIAPPDADGAKQAVSQYQFAPLWMTRLQPSGTPGVHGDWNGNPRWPNHTLLDAAKDPHRAAGEALNFTALRDWFLPLYAAWKADPAAAITIEEAAAALADDAHWIKPPFSGRQTDDEDVIATRA